MANFSEPMAVLPERPTDAEADESTQVTVHRTHAETLAPSAWDLDTKRIVIIILLVVGLGTVWAIRSFIPMLVIAGYRLFPQPDSGLGRTRPRSACH